MRINPIKTNNNNNNYSFKATIKPSESLKEAFKKAEKYTNSGTMKDMDTVKTFIDSLVRINESEKITKYKIEIDKSRPEYTYTKINGKRVSGGSNERQQNLQDSYIVMESTNKFASRLEEIQPSALDTLRAQIEEAESVLDNLKTRYCNRLKAELEQAQQFIFKKAE